MLTSLLVTLAAGMTLVHAHFIGVRRADTRYEGHMAIIKGEAESPYRYRVLIPFAVHYAATAAHKVAGLPYRGAAAALHEAAVFLGLSLGYVLFFFYLMKWFTPEVAFCGSLYLIGITAFCFMYISFQPWGWWDLATFTAAAWLAQSGRRWPLLALVVLGTLVRETAILIAPLFLFTRWSVDPPVKAIGWTGLLGGVSAAIILGLRMILGWAPHVGQNTQANPLFYRLIHNFTTPMPATAGILFFGALWVLAMRNLAAKPACLRRCLLFIPIFLCLHLFAAHMNEARYYFEISPIVIPLAFFSLFPDSVRPQPLPAP